MNYGNILWPNSQLQLGDFLTSQQGNYTLTLRTDGTLAIQNVNTSTEHIMAAFDTANRLIMQGDGNLVLYDSNNFALFNTGTEGKPGTILIIQDDGNLVLYQFPAPVNWASNTVGL